MTGTSYPDLSQPIAVNSSYPDLSQPISGQDSSAGNSAPQDSLWQDALSYAKKILPNPATMPMPLMMNVTAGLMSNFAPPSARNALSQAPQILSGQNYGIPQKIASGVGQSIPALMSGGSSLLTQSLSGGALGAAGADPGNRLLSGATNALSIPFFGKVLPEVSGLVKSIVNPTTAKDFAQNIQGVHDAINQDASQGFQQVSQGVNDRGISQVPLDPTLVDDINNAAASGYLPNKKQTIDLLNSAASGDYNSLRGLQSEFWQKGTKAASSDSLIDNNKGDEIFDLRDRINDAISNHLITTGNEDLNDTLQNSMSKYRYLKDTFYNKNLDPGIRKLVNPDIRAVPNNLGTLIQKDSIPMQNVRNALNAAPQGNWLGKPVSPFSQNIQDYNTKNSLGALGKKLGITGIGAGELYGLYKLSHPTESPSISVGGDNEND